MSVLENYVRLKRNATTVIVLRNPRVETRTITDPKTKRPKEARAWVADCTEENGVPVTKIFSTLSEKLAGNLDALHRAGQLEGRRIGITWRPADYATEYEVHAL